MSRFIIVGKGASGKDWLQSKMVSKGYKKMKQFTTRPIRDSEVGDEYHFITNDEFDELYKLGHIVSRHFYSIGWYGISLNELDNCDVAILSPGNISDIEDDAPWILDDFTIIYLDIPIEIRRERLSNRYKSRVDDSVERRISADENDFKDFTKFDVRLTSVEEIDNFINKISSNV